MYTLNKLFPYKIRKFKEDPAWHFAFMCQMARKTYESAGYHPLSMFVFSTERDGAPDYHVYAKTLMDASIENKERLSETIHAFVRESKAIAVINISESWMQPDGEEGMRAYLAWRKRNPELSMAHMPGRRDMLHVIMETHARNFYAETEVKDRKLGEWRFIENGMLGEGTTFGSYLRPLQN